MVILDLLPDMSGIDALARIREAHPEARAIILSTFDGSEDIHRSFETGSRCFLRKDVERDELLRAVREVAAGRRVVTGLAADRLAERMSHQPLTEREHQVLTLIVRGRSNKEIAADLNISEVTVKAHVSRVLEKLGVEDRTQAATAALRRGIVHAQWPER